MLPPHTIVGTDGSSIIGVSSIGAAESAAHPHRVRLVVGRVVEDLLAVDRLDAGAQPGGHDGQRVVGPARVDAADQQRGATVARQAAVEPLDPLRRRRARVVQRVQRRRDDVGTRAQAPLDVARWPRRAGCLPTPCRPPRRTSAARRRRPCWRATPVRARQPGERRRVPARLVVGDEVMTPTSSSPGNATADRIAVAPMLPVPQTTTRLISPTLAACCGASWQTSHPRPNGAAQRRLNARFDRPDQPSGWLASRNLLDTALRSSYQPV